MNKKRVVLVAVVLVLFFGGAGYGVYVLSQNAQKGSTSETSSSQISSQVSENIDKGNFGEAQKVAEEAYKAEATDDNARTLALAYAASGDNKAVIETVTKIPESNLTYNDYQNLAVAYDLNGQVAEAAAAYRKAADLWPTDSPLYDAETTYLRNQANALEGKADGF